MPDPLDYTLVRMDNNIPDKAVLTYDAVNDKITDSGMTALYGELQAGADSVAVGLQTMSSAGEQVTWENEHSSVVYAPPWHIIDEINTEGSRDRIYGPVQESVVFSDKSGVVSNPINTINVPENGIVFRYTIEFPVARTGVVLSLTYLDPNDPTLTEEPKALWREVRDISAGENEITLTVPNSLYAGQYFFSIKPVNPVDAPIEVVGNPQTGEFAYSTRFRTFREIPLATKEYVDAAVTGSSASDIMTKAVYDTDNDGKVNIAAMADQAVQVVGITSAGNDFYYGKDSTGVVGFHALPAGADEAKLQALIEDNTKEIIQNKGDIAKHETSIDAHGVQLATNTGNITHNSATLNVLKRQYVALNSEVSTLRRNAVNKLIAESNIAAKTITFKLMSEQGLVDSVLLDLNPFLGGSATTHTIYHGFSADTLINASEVTTSGTLKEVTSIGGYDVHMTRNQADDAYLYIWIPDALGTVKGFTFSGFLSQWAETALAINGIQGKVYVSPNKTRATDVTFEVTV